MHGYIVQREQVIQLLRQMGVVVPEGLYYDWSISADNQFLQVYLTDDPTVATITETVVDLTPVIPDPPLPPPAGFTVQACLPTEAASGALDLMLRVHGTLFEPTSVILFANQDEPTIYVSSTEVATIVKPALFAPATVPVQVRTAGVIAPPTPSSVTFTFTPAA